MHENPESLLSTRQFYNFSAELYKDFLGELGSEEWLKSRLNVQFGLWAEDVSKKQLDQKAQIKKLEGDYSRLNSQLDGEI